MDLYAYILNVVYQEVGYVVMQLVEALSYKLEGHGFDLRWGH
jgi:hypothetical protein